MKGTYLEVSGRTYYAFEEPEFIGPPSPVLAAAVEGCEMSGGKPRRFWRRQFGPVVTARQRKFDWVFGVFLPLVCFYFDPLVFRFWNGDGGVFEDYRVFVYVLSSVSIMTLTAWLLWGNRLEWLNGWFAGLFFAASGVSLVVGLVLVPISLFGLMVLIGVLGFTPLFSAVIFARNGVRALRASRNFFDTKTLAFVAALSGLMSLVVPFVIGG